MRVQLSDASAGIVADYGAICIVTNVENLRSRGLVTWFRD